MKESIKRHLHHIWTHISIKIITINKIEMSIKRYVAIFIKSNKYKRLNINKKSITTYQVIKISDTSKSKAIIFSLN